jgi:hypothetical protein
MPTRLRKPSIERTDELKCNRSQTVRFYGGLPVSLWKVNRPVSHQTAMPCQSADNAAKSNQHATHAKQGGNSGFLRLSTKTFFGKSFGKKL